MEQKKHIAVSPLVFSIQLFDACSGQLHQMLVTRKGFLVGIPKIGQESKVQVVVTIGQESDFERLNEVGDALGILKERRDDDQGS